MNRVRLVSLLMLLLLPLAGWAAQPGLEAVTVTTNPGGGQTYSLSIQVLLLMTALTFLPALLMMMTAFTRIIIVLAIIRQAVGLMQAPSNQVLVGLALFLTFFVMAPVFDRINTEAVQPYLDSKITLQDGLQKASVPLRKFMLADAVPLTVLVPAFVTSELKTAFQIGFLLFIPFLIIDLVVASVLMSMGMMMLSPMIVSLPFKLMLFVLVDGWALIIGTLASSFYV